MANTINDLYLKYVNKVGRVLENDRYFQYMFEMAQNGETTVQQSNRIMHKEVDQRWLNIVEDSLDAINNIIDKPRRFIKTNEEVVPVALAKKITANSVRHLCQNTQFIAAVNGDDIQPTKILNVVTEETYDLYENRFIFTLMKRLITFIDKRTDVIFWSTGDEKASTLAITNKIDDAYEEIEYKIEMTIKNKQSFAENDSENLEVFKRIDRVRRLVLALRSSAFYEIMKDSTPVRSPIQRTNLMMKEPNYKKCYALWQFLERYDEIGYTIDVRDSVLEFDEDYMFQMYTNFINNYVVFKSLLENDSRRIMEMVPKRHKVVKPKFIKQIVEQIVDDYDIPDVEIKRVIVEEVTKAQLLMEKKQEAERLRLEKEKLAKEKEKEKIRIAKEKEKEKIRIAKEKEKEKIRVAKEKEKERLAKEKAAEKAKIAKEKAAVKAKIEKEKALEKARIAKEKEREKARIAKEKEKEKARIAKEKEKEKAKIAREKEREKAKQLRAKERAAEKVRLAKEKAQRAKEEQEQSKIQVPIPEVAQVEVKQEEYMCVTENEELVLAENKEAVLAENEEAVLVENEESIVAEMEEGIDKGEQGSSKRNSGILQNILQRVRNR